MGLATLDFFLKRIRERRTLIRALVLAGAALLYPLLLTALTLLGCFELIFRLRERFRLARPGI